MKLGWRTDTATATVKPLLFILQMASTLESVKAIVMYRGEVPEGTDCGFPVYTWDQFMEVSYMSQCVFVRSPVTL